MLAKLPCVPRTPTSRSLLIPCEDSDGDAVAFGSTAPMSAPCPCKVVIGFDVGSENKRLPHVCESPRSVLEIATALPSQEKRSPRSALGSLLAAKTRSDEDGAVVYSTITGSPVAEKCLLPPACEFCQESKVGMFHHNASGLQTVPCQCDFSGDFAACDEQGLHLLPQEDLKDELLDADIRPLQVAENGSLLENDEAKNVLNSTPPSQTLSFLLGNLVKVDEMVATECKQRDETADTKSYRCLHNGVPLKEPIREGMAVPDPAFLLDSSPELFCRRSIVNDRNGPQRIFVASPPYRPRSYGMITSGFLKSCNLCGCFLNHGRDIFMYRGDQTFCSAECRYQKILLDDSKNSKSLNISKVALVTEKIEADVFKSCLDSAR